MQEYLEILEFPICHLKCLTIDGGSNLQRFRHTAPQRESLKTSYSATSNIYAYNVAYAAKPCSLLCCPSSPSKGFENPQQDSFKVRPLTPYGEKLDRGLAELLRSML